LSTKPHFLHLLKAEDIPCATVLEVLSDLRGLLLRQKASGEAEHTSSAAASCKYFLDEMGNACDGHKYVCERFGGGTSILER
jgi:hypothetical protein